MKALGLALCALLALIGAFPRALPALTVTSPRAEIVTTAAESSASAVTFDLVVTSPRALSSNTAATSSPRVTDARAATSTDAGEKRYARADCRDAYFCAEPSKESGLFAIPYTYCVELLGDEGEWYRVRYAEDSGIYKAISGYCLKEKLTPLDTAPQNPFLVYPVGIRYQAVSPAAGSLPALSEITVTAAYYGAFESGLATYSYVLYGGAFGYVAGGNEDYPLNEIPQKAQSEEPPSDLTAKITVGVVVSLLALAAVFFLFFSGKKRPAKK